MVVLIIITAAAGISLFLFNGMKETNPELLEQVLFRIQQQAGVMASYCAAIFAVIAALRTGKLAGIPTPSAVATATSAMPPPSGVWGRPAREVAATS